MKRKASHLPALLVALCSADALSQVLAQPSHAEHEQHQDQHAEHSEPFVPHIRKSPSVVDHHGMRREVQTSAAGVHHEHDEHPPAATTSRTLIPAITAADRSAVFLDPRGHTVHDSAIVTFLRLDRFEWQDARDGDALSWEVTGWVGNDIDRLWLRSEGERSDSQTEEAELQLLWGHALGPWREAVAGVRHDFQPGMAQTWGAVGFQGAPLYDVETTATLYVGEGGQSAIRLAGEYDVLLTNRLILQPTVEINAYGKNDRARGVGAGLADAEIGLRLRYEIRREIAPYIGVSWTRRYGNTADLAREEHASVEETRLVIGIRAWY